MCKITFYLNQSDVPNSEPKTNNKTVFADSIKWKKIVYIMMKLKDSKKVCQKTGLCIILSTSFCIRPVLIDIDWPAISNQYY